MMQSNVFPQPQVTNQWFGRPFTQPSGQGGAPDYGKAFQSLFPKQEEGGFQNLPYINPEVQAMRDWAAGRQPQPQQGAQTLEWNEERDRRPGDDQIQLLGSQQSNMFQPQQVLKQFPGGQGPVDVMRGVGQGALTGVGQIARGIGRAGSNLGDALFGESQGAQQPFSNVMYPMQDEQADAAQQRAYAAAQQSSHLAVPQRQRGLSIQSRQQPIQPHEADRQAELDAAQQRYESAVQGAQPRQQGNQYAPPSVDPRDLMPSPARVRQQQAAAQRKTQAAQLAGMQGLNTDLRGLAELHAGGETINQGPMALGPDAMRQLAEQDRLQGQQMSAVNGSAGYRTGQAGGDPGVLAHGRNRDANREFAMTPGGAQMNRFAQLQAMQSNVNPPQSDDTQANLAEMQKDPRYRDMVKVMPFGSPDAGRLALTGKQATQEQSDAQAERIASRRAARGGMSERQARDVSRRMDKPSALADYAIRNGLENHPMVRSILGGGQGSAVYGNTPGGSGGQPSAAERTEAKAEATTAEANSAYANRAGFARTEDGVPSHQETVAAMFTHQDQPTFSDLGEWAKIHQSRVTEDSSYGNNSNGTPSPTIAEMNKLAEQVIAAKSRGDEEKVMALYEKIKKQEEQRSKDQVEAAKDDYSGAVGEM
jgi:hypothetical protein